MPLPSSPPHATFPSSPPHVMTWQVWSMAENIYAEEEEGGPDDGDDDDLE